MKKYLLGLMTIVMMAVVCVGFSACGSDDDGDGNGGSSNNCANVNGKNIAVPYGFYSYEGEWILTFTNYDVNNPQTAPSSINYLSINISNSPKGDGVPVGEFSPIHVYVVYNASRSSEGEQYESGYDGDSGKGKVNISKNGDVYTVTYSGVNLIRHDDKKTFENTSFSWSGRLTEAHFDD